MNKFAGLLILLASFPLAAGNLYKCTVNGKTTYQHGLCQADQAETVINVVQGNQTAAPVRPHVLPPQYGDVAIARDADGRIKRSESAKNDFKHIHPCPANGRRSGACPGYVIDHITPLACGGPDAPSNMQWQTTRAAKDKDKWERDGCDLTKSAIRQPTIKRIRAHAPAANDSTYGGNSLVHVGPRGGRYVITSSGHKRYLPRH